MKESRNYTAKYGPQNISTMVLFRIYYISIKIWLLYRYDYLLEDGLNQSEGGVECPSRYAGCYHDAGISYDTRNQAVCDAISCGVPLDDCDNGGHEEEGHENFGQKYFSIEAGCVAAHGWAKVLHQISLESHSIFHAPYLLDALQPNPNQTHHES